ncbi:MAG TPA: site-specific integrase [Pyrinomonadaceae bacterium]|jgi:integrase
MAKDRTGYVYEENKKWIARVTTTDETGKRRNIRRSANSKSEAKELLKQIVRQLDDEGVKAIDTANLTFDYLALHYEKNFLHPAQYVNGRKISGLRDVDRAKRVVVHFRSFFGKKKLRLITYGDVASYKRMRMATPTVHNRQRNIATMNRELVVLRRMFNIALAQDWIVKNPFNCGEPLITPADERIRARILTVDEETRLLAVCDIPRRQYLKSLLITMLDTAARKNEVQQLTWQYVDFDNRLITFIGQTTKTLKTRQVAMTQRLYYELWSIWHQSDKDLSAKVFGKRCIRTVFRNACREAKIPHGGIDGITPHQARHTAATRLVNGNLPIQIVGKILGHTQPQTTYRYLTANDETLHQAASILEKLQELPASSEFIN